MMSRRFRHVPFVLFLAGLTAFTAWLQFHMASYASALLSLHIFFQVMLGATLVAVLRNLVGLKTYGTFGAVILATAMLVEGPLLGFLLFGAMLLTVVLARAAMSKEGIQESHRVAILVIVVAVAAVFSSLAGWFTQAPAFAYAALFPILITAWVAERFVEEVAGQGWYPGLRTLAFTAIAIVAAYVVMIWTSLVTFVIVNPLTWSGLVVVNWALGTLLRFRLSERLRFRGVTLPPEDPDLGGTVLSMTRRNRDYVDRYNPPQLLATLDKAKAKNLLVPAGIPMPRTYMIVRSRQELPQVARLLDRLQAVAIKPSSSYGGEGIILVRGRKGNRFRVNGHVETKEQLLRHVQRIVDGEFHDGAADAAILEDLVQQDPVLAPLAPEGVADIRIVSLLGYPAMAMARLPTKRSRGRANLHSGAVGAGIDLSSGRITTAVWNGVRIEAHPDTGVLLRGFQIPRWNEILEVASAAQTASGLGFAGVDVVLDVGHGPVVLEVNRRPGLEIQNANRHGLLPRLRAIEALAHRGAPVEERVRTALDLDALGWSGVRRSGPSSGATAVSPASQSQATRG